MIYNVRGPFGSGKTTIVREIVNSATEVRNVMTQKENGKPYIEGHRLAFNPDPTRTEMDLFVVGGDYQRTDVSVAGCDKIQPHARNEEIVRFWMGETHILFEGVLISGLFGKWYQLDCDSPDGMTWMFLDTPWEVCIDRIYKRNGGKKINEDNVRSKFRAVVSVREKCIDLGSRIVDLDYTNPMPKILETMRADGVRI